MRKAYEDISWVPLNQISDSWFIKQEQSPRGYYRYSLEQVQRIAQLVYLPHQIDQWNKMVRGEDGKPVGTLSREGRQVTLEEILPLAFKHIEELYNHYTSIKPGQYYVIGGEDSLDNPYFFNWNDTRLRDLRSKGSPSDWVSRKRFEGFVVKEADFEFSLTGSDFVLPDRDLFLSWDLAGRAGMDPQIHPGLKSHFYPTTRGLSRGQFRDFIFGRFKLWRKKFRELRAHPDLSGKYEGKYADQAETDFQEGFLPNFMNSKFLGSMMILCDRSEALKYGHWLATETVKGPQEAFDFAKRFFTNLDPGEKISQWD